MRPGEQNTQNTGAQSNAQQASQVDVLAAMQSKMDEMQRQIAALKELSDATAQQNEELISQTAALKKQLQSATAPKPAESKAMLPKDTFEVDGVTYRFRVPRFRAPMDGVLGGVIITAIDALADQELLKKLVAAQSGVIQVAQ